MTFLLPRSISDAIPCKTAFPSSTSSGPAYYAGCQCIAILVGAVCSQFDMAIVVSGSFFSAWIGGLVVGIISTLLAAILGVYFFLPPYESFALAEFKDGYAVCIFVFLGGLINVVFERLKIRQQALQEAINDLKLNEKDRLAQALTVSNAGLWEWDLTNGQIYWSDTLRSMYGLKDETNSTHDNWLMAVHEEDRVSVMAHLHDLLSHDKAINLEWRVANLPDDQERWLFTNGQPLRNEDGRIIFYRGIVLDITERKKHENRLQEEQQRLDFALKTLHAGAWELNLRSNTSHRTELHDQIFGYQQPLADWSFEQFVEHVLPEEKAALTGNLNAKFAEQMAKLPGFMPKVD